MGLIIGFLFSVLFRRIHIRDTIKVLLFLSFSFLFVAFENVISDYVPFSGLLAVIAMGAIFYARNKECTARLSSRYSKLWVAAEILLFVLVGATVDIQLIFNSGGLIIAVIIIALIFRMIGVYLSVIGTKLNYKERLFCMIAYTPKATVQAAIGGIPISMGLACGGIVLTAAVLSILITAPIGAFVTDISYKRLLQKEECVSL